MSVKNFLLLLVFIQINHSVYSQGLNKNGGSETNPDNILDNTGASGTGKGANSNGKIAFFKDGKTRARAASSALQIKTDYPLSTDGVYWIDLPGVGPKQTYCLMDFKYNGGGWMLALKATRGTTFHYDANYWTTANTLNQTDVTLADSDAKYDVMNRFAAKDMMALWPDIIKSGTEESGSIDNLTQWNWLQNNFHNSGGRTTLISKFNGSQVDFETYLDGTMSFSGFSSSVFSYQVGFTFYGLNYTGNVNRKVRWGFAWNQESDQLSNDASGGIGMDYLTTNYSAGDYLSSTDYGTIGINRSARVELYIR